jgi:hypothetical protein
MRQLDEIPEGDSPIFAARRSGQSPAAMRQPEESRTNRRRVVTGLLRAAALAGLGGMSAYLLARSAPAGDDAQCTGASRCGHCPVRPTCRLPQAGKAKER